jgi:hypothetical protein
VIGSFDVAPARKPAGAPTVHGTLARSQRPALPARALAPTGDTGIQCKLRVGSPSDPLELEADATADRILAGAGIGPVSTGKVAKRHDPDDEIHGKFSGVASASTADLESRVGALGGGQPLPASERAFFEPRFGHDFSRVRVHATPEAAAVSGSLRANAFARGQDIAFAAGQWSPGTTEGRRLLAHELTHVVQQGQGATPGIQRDLAIPPPAPTPAAQAALTPDQIAAAIRFNRSMYDATRTKQIQDLVGTTPTGIWTNDDILMIAQLQEEYGLTKDGKVGPETFRFLDRETRAERLRKTNANCLLAFRVDVDPAIVGPVAGGSRSITGHHAIRAQFSSYCGCAEYEYRQFIRGHWRRTRVGVVTDLGPTFATIPGGAGLTAAFQEDGNTTTPALNYGHRAQVNEGTNNGYFTDAAAATRNQVDGCHYRGDDTPGGPDNVVAGDVFDILVQFRGEIQRNGVAVETKTWNDINGRFPA